MRLYKPNYRANDGTTRPTRKYYIAFKDHQDIRRNWPLFNGKKESERCAERIDQLIALRRVSSPMTAGLSQWFDKIPDRLRYLLVKADLVDRQRVTSGQPFKTHIDNFKRSLRLKGRTAKYINLTAGFIGRTIEACDFRTFTDITIEAIEAHLETLLTREKKPIGKRTFNAYVKALKQFTRWAERSGLITISPLRYLDVVTVTKQDHIKQRRALSTDDLIHLLNTTKLQPERFGMTGPQRSAV